MSRTSIHLPDSLPPVPGVVPLYARLKLQAKQLRLSDWSVAQAALYYPYPPSTRPHPCMGLAKFVGGMIFQKRSGKGYLTAHPSWEHADANTTCPLWSEAAQTFTHAILSCPLSARQRSHLVQGVSDLAPEAPIWSDHQLLITLAEYIRTTAPGFPPGIPWLAPSLHTAPNPLFPSTILPTPDPRD